MFTIKFVKDGKLKMLAPTAVAKVEVGKPEYTFPEQDVDLSASGIESTAVISAYDESDYEDGKHLAIVADGDIHVINVGSKQKLFSIDKKKNAGSSTFKIGPLYSDVEKHFKLVYNNGDKLEEAHYYTGEAKPFIFEGLYSDMGAGLHEFTDYGTHLINH